jgi:hypothetical protein
MVTIVYGIEAVRQELGAGGYETVLYNYVHNLHFFGYGFYLHWGVSTQLLWWFQGIVAVMGMISHYDCIAVRLF